jgi:hypothetical protein
MLNGARHPGYHNIKPTQHSNPQFELLIVKSEVALYSTKCQPLLLLAQVILSLSTILEMADKPTSSSFNEEK